MIKIHPVYSIPKQLPRPITQVKKISLNKEDSYEKSFQEILQEKRQQLTRYV